MLSSAGRVLRESTGGAVPDGYRLPVDRSLYASGFMRPVQQVTVPVRDFQRVPTQMVCESKDDILRVKYYTKSLRQTITMRLTCLSVQ